MHKRMGCKADGEVKYRSNLMVVRILTSHPTKQAAFYAPRLKASDQPLREPYPTRW